MTLQEESAIRNQLTGSPFLIGLLIRRQAIRKGHYKFTAGDCSEFYCNKDAVLGEQPTDHSLCLEMARMIPVNWDVRTVVGPARNGIALASGLALALTEIHGHCHQHVGVFSHEGRLIIPRQNRWRIKPPIIIVDDVVSTGKTMDQVAEELGVPRDAIAGRSCLIDRRPKRFGRNSDVLSLVQADFPVWRPGVTEKCPMCINRIPFDPVLGHGQDILPALFPS